ncbi:cell surface protein [Moraxella catarrhalis]|uniref:YadA C-terminal domain-containing protein n=1 Tax=Moraxella catarrhalis TaxID=480 RepID=UPI00128DC64A|nr:YadA C-terminal domain-containing protein [Moraxella catarrhalis]MPX13683.1 cell surface protein [Moraxella catarrhalis]
MKTMKLLPLKIAVTSALIVGLGAASTANAQLVERFFPNIFLDKPLAKQHYHNVVVGDTSIVSDLQSNSDQLKFYSDDEGLVPDSLLFNKMLHEQLLNGFKEGDTIIPLDENGKPVYKVDYKLDGKEPRKVYSVTTKIATAEDVATSSYANGIQKDIDDLYDFDHQVTERLTQHGKTIYRNGERILANEESVQYLNKEVQNNIEHIYELAQQQDQHSSDIKTLESNVEKGLLELSGHLIDQKADLTKDIKTLENNVEEGLLDLSGRLIDQKADIAQNQANIQDLAAYNELQDQYAQKQTEAIDALNKASSENTQNIEDLAAYNELQDAYAKQQTEAIDALNKASSENTQNIAKNQADIANNINNIYELAQQQDQHSSDIKTLAKASAANTDRIAKNKADADASFETLTKNQNTLIEKDKEHDKLITANKTAIDTNKASADTKFAATADAITKNGNAITKNAKSITDLGTKVDGFDSRVTALDTKVNALDTKVNAFDGRITALDSKVENGMAAQAALSGLFQPYSVGKFNATAALGGYGSKSAVAIGAGYRVNPNLAFKAGAAINTSGNKKGSYNIGVNYEF